MSSCLVRLDCAQLTLKTPGKFTKDRRTNLWELSARKVASHSQNSARRAYIIFFFRRFFLPRATILVEKKEMLVVYLQGDYLFHYNEDFFKDSEITKAPMVWDNLYHKSFYEPRQLYQLTSSKFALIAVSSIH